MAEILAVDSPRDRARHHRVDLRNYDPPAAKVLAGCARADSRFELGPIRAGVGDVRDFSAVVPRDLVAPGAEGIWLQASGVGGGAHLVYVGDGALSSRRDLAGARARLPDQTVWRERGRQFHLADSRVVHVPLRQRADRRLVSALVHGEDLRAQ